MIVPIKQMILEDALTVIPPIEVETPKEKFRLDNREKVKTFTRRSMNGAATNVNNRMKNTIKISSGIGGLVGASAAGALMNESPLEDGYNTSQAISEVLPIDPMMVDPVVPAALYGAGMGAAVGATIGDNIASKRMQGNIAQKSGNIMDRLDKHGVGPQPSKRNLTDLMMQLNILKRMYKK